MKNILISLVFLLTACSYPSAPQTIIEENKYIPPTATCEEAFLDPIHNSSLMNVVSEQKYQSLINCFCNTLSNDQCGEPEINGQGVDILLSQEEVNALIAYHASQAGDSTNQKWFNQCSAVESTCVSDTGKN